MCDQQWMGDQKAEFSTLRARSMNSSRIRNIRAHTWLLTRFWKPVLNCKWWAENTLLVKLVWANNLFRSQEPTRISAPVVSYWRSARKFAVNAQWERYWERRAEECAVVWCWNDQLWFFPGTDLKHTVAEKASLRHLREFLDALSSFPAYTKLTNFAFASASTCVPLEPLQYQSRQVLFSLSRVQAAKMRVIK